MKSLKQFIEEKENKKLNKPFRLPSGSNKKFGVYVKNGSGKVVKVTFGDSNMEIKKEDLTDKDDDVPKFIEKKIKSA